MIPRLWPAAFTIGWILAAISVAEVLHALVAWGMKDGETYAFAVSKIGGLQLFRLESSDRSESVLPRVRSIATAVLQIYLAITVACFTTYWLLGMTLPRAGSTLQRRSPRQRRRSATSVRAWDPSSDRPANFASLGDFQN